MLGFSGHLHWDPYCYAITTFTQPRVLKSMIIGSVLCTGSESQLHWYSSRQYILFEHTNPGVPTSQLQTVKNTEHPKSAEDYQLRRAAPVAILSVSKVFSYPKRQCLCALCRVQRQSLGCVQLMRGQMKMPTLQQRHLITFATRCSCLPTCFTLRPAQMTSVQLDASRNKVSARALCAELSRVCC